MAFITAFLGFLEIGTERVSADAAGTPVPGNLVVNGSFEDAPEADFTIFPSVVTGWIQTTPCGLEVWSHGFIRVADDGHRLIELDANCNAALQQQVPTVGGQTYKLSYAFSARPGTALASNALNVFVNGVLVANHGAISSDFTSWRHFSINITATGPTTTIKFAGAGTSDSLGSLLDSVSLVAVTPPVAVPTFSIPFETPEDVEEVCICTPLLMNTDVTGTQNWWVKAIGGDLTITAIAHAVTDGDGDPGDFGETVRAEIFDGANASVGVIVASYTHAEATPGFERASSFVIPDAGGIYRVSVSTPNGNPRQPHYRLRFGNAEAAATSSPSSPSFEHEAVKWYFNVGNENTLDIRVSISGTPAATSTLHYTLVRPNGSTHSTNSVTASASMPPPPPDPPLPPVDGHITVASAESGTWTLIVTNASEHYRLDKTTGSDRGIYLSWQSAGFGTLTAVALNGSLAGTPLFTGGAVEFVVYNSDNVEVARQVTNDGDVDFGDLKLPAGLYTVRINTPFGWSANVDSITVAVLCDKPAVVTFTLRDVLAPEGFCTPSFNPSGGNIPRASRINEDGFYLVSGRDNSGAATIRIGSYDLRNPETIKITQTPGQAGVTFVNTMVGKENIRHFRVGPGDAELTITDAAGNSTKRVCFVPPPPK